MGTATARLSVTPCLRVACNKRPNGVGLSAVRSVVVRQQVVPFLLFFPLYARLRRPLLTAVRVP